LTQSATLDDDISHSENRRTISQTSELPSSSQIEMRLLAFGSDLECPNRVINQMKKVNPRRKEIGDQSRATLVLIANNELEIVSPLVLWNIQQPPGGQEAPR
jgi:TFIIF-interacting CTD phosphatase-like protein